MSDNFPNGIGVLTFAVIPRFIPHIARHDRSLHDSLRLEFHTMRGSPAAGYGVWLRTQMPREEQIEQGLDLYTDSSCLLASLLSSVFHSELAVQYS